MDDLSLLNAYADQRSEEAFRELVRRHGALVHAVARRQAGVDAYQADDIAQRVFLTLMRKAHGFDRSANVVGWLYMAARFEAMRVVRAEARRRSREEKTALMDDALHSSSAEPQIPWETLAPVLDEAMAKLSETERDAVLLRYFSGRTFAEVGRVYQISEDGARRRVDRAVEKLRQILGRRGIVSTATALGAALGANASPALTDTALTAIAEGAWQQAAVSQTVTFGVFMSSTKATLAVVGTVILLASALALRDFSATTNADENQTAAATKLTGLERERADARRELVSLQRQKAAMETRAREVRATPATPPPAPARTYLLDPTYRAMAGTAFQTRRHLEFQRFYRQLNLSPEQIARFEEIMVQQDQSNLDAQIAKDQGRDEQEVFQKSGPAWSTAMQALLGADGFDQLKVYLRSNAIRNFVDSIAAHSYDTGEPITLAQADQLIALALANDSTFQSGKGTDPSKVNWNAVWEPAEKFLSPEQILTFERTVDVWLLQKRVSLLKAAAAGAR